MMRGERRGCRLRDGLKPSSTHSLPPPALLFFQTCPHGSIHHSWPHPGSTGLQQREDANPSPRARAPAPHMAASLELCPAVGLPWASQLWALSCVLPRPQGEGWERKGGGSWGRGKKGGMGGASISNFIINTLFSKAGALFPVLHAGFCTELHWSFTVLKGGRRGPTRPLWLPSS